MDNFFNAQINTGNFFNVNTGVKKRTVQETNNNTELSSSESNNLNSQVSHSISELFNVFNEAFGDNPLVSFKNISAPLDEEVKQTIYTA